MKEIIVDEPLYVVTGYHLDTDSNVFCKAFKSKVDAMEVINYAQKTVPNMHWDYEYVTQPSVEYAKHMVDVVKEGWEEYEDPADYVGMGWTDSRGRP